MTTWRDIEDEYRQDRIGQHILGLTRQVIAQVVRRYDPTIYAMGAQAWTDEAIDDLLQDLTLAVLLGEAQIDYAFLAGNLTDFRGLIEFQLRRYLSRRRVRSVVDNLLDRALPILRESPFLVRRLGGKDRYRLYGAPPGDAGPEDGAIREATIAVLSVPRLGSRSGDRAPVLYTTENLRALLNAVAKTLGSEFTIGDLDRVLRAALTPFVGSPLVEVEENVPDSTALSPEEHALAAEAASRIAGVLSTNQAWLLLQKLANVADSDIAIAMGVSRPTVIKRKQEVQELLVDALTGLTDRVAQAALSFVATQLALTG